MAHSLLSRIARLRRYIIAFLATLGALVVVVTLTPVVFWWGGLLAGNVWWEVAGGRHGPTGGTLIVLAGSSLDGTVLGDSSYWRSVYAVRVYHLGGIQRVVLVGVPAPLMRDFLVAHGVPREIIEMDTRSISTRENALFTAALLSGYRASPVLLTSDYHMFRARRAFRKAGLNVQPCPVPDVRKRGSYWLSRWPAFLDLLIETAKIVGYGVQGWI